MKLSRVQRDKLWGEDGPYSEVDLTVESRILDDKISRKFLIVEVHLNPLSYEIIKKNRAKFRNDPMIQQLLDHSEFRGQSFGYVAWAFHAEYRDSAVLAQAQECLEYAQETVIKIHKFVMQMLNLTTS